jgi:hypothetical protein
MIATYEGEPNQRALHFNVRWSHRKRGELSSTTPFRIFAVTNAPPKGMAALANFTIKTARITDLRDDGNVAFARDLSLLAVNAFAMLPAKITDAWFSSPANVAGSAELATCCQPTGESKPLPPLGDDINSARGASLRQLASTIFGDSRQSTLFNDADVAYLLAVRDADRIPPANRGDVALLVRDGYLSAYPDATLRPQEPLTHGRIVHALAPHSRKQKSSAATKRKCTTDG